MSTSAGTPARADTAPASADTAPATADTAPATADTAPATADTAPATADTAPATASAFDPSRPYALHPQLALRPERFGALAYHYGNRRLTFLKSPQLTAIVETLAEHPSADAALDAHGVTTEQRPAMLGALARLQRSEVISAR